MTIVTWDWLKFSPNKKMWNFKSSTKSSKLLLVLISILFFPVRKTRDNKLIFKISSPKTWLFIIIYIVTTLFISSSNFLYDSNYINLTMAYFERMETIQRISVFANVGFYSANYFAPLLFAHAVPNLASVALSKELKWTKQGRKYFLCIFINIISSALLQTCMMSEMTQEY